MRRLAIVAAWLAVGASAPPVVDIAIRGGTLYDGSTRRAVVGDVEIVGGRIAYVGPPRRTPARRVINAQGLVVAPGFIDAHTHPDSYIRSPDPAARANAPWLAQGVSTIVVGVDGYGSPDVARDMKSVVARGVGTNMVPFVGFGAVRGRVLGAAARAPDAIEMGRMRALVAGAMCDGASGFSTGLFYAPQSYATTEEVIALAREVG
ncbi:amidohydrolase family protein [Sphingomonas donggukensis]|uniref:amidohydrolase family protein n=1 Tax=Sphingomonas donggukensis TaxID=2949093 RepID=UPI0030F4653E